MGLRSACFWASFVLAVTFCVLGVVWMSLVRYEFVGDNGGNYIKVGSNYWKKESSYVLK